MNKITLGIARGRTYLDIYHKGELIGTIKISEQNRTTQVSLELTSDKEVTRYNINRTEQIVPTDSFFNKEEFNK